ncbi:hypothetical protein [Methylosinus sp. sav-2]|uniref:hypothetical protein n=1 Tax=Methylosinus sp. sav-2 TaxID=2485168 RepID=UPI0012F6B559|nr:hypothetical protein [Methylosinus sp. sav-2]
MHLDGERMFVESGRRLYPAVAVLIFRIEDRCGAGSNNARKADLRARFGILPANTFGEPCNRRLQDRREGRERCRRDPGPTAVVNGASQVTNRIGLAGALRRSRFREADDLQAAFDPTQDGLQIHTVFLPDSGKSDDR